MNDENSKQSNLTKKPSRRRYIIAAGMFVLLILIGISVSFLRCDPKPDPDSEMNIRIAVARRQYNMTGLMVDPNNLTDEDFAKVEALGLGFPQGQLNSNSNPFPLCLELSDIIFLEKFTNLQDLGIRSLKYPPNKIPKWTTMLAKLGIYDLDKRITLDLSPLKKLNNLESLRIEMKNVKNLKSIENLTNLQTLQLYGLQINNIEYVKKLTNLRKLEIGDIQISDLTPIKGLINLEWLVMGSIPVSDLEPVKSLKNLQYLYIINCKNISYKQIEDLQKSLPELEIYR